MDIATINHTIAKSQPLTWVSINSYWKTKRMQIKTQLGGCLSWGHLTQMNLYIAKLTFPTKRKSRNTCRPHSLLKRSLDSIIIYYLLYIHQSNKYMHYIFINEVIKYIHTNYSSWFISKHFKANIKINHFSCF